MKIGQLLKFVPKYPYPSFTGESSLLDNESVVMLVNMDFVGFKSEVLIGEQKFWVRNSDLFELLPEDSDDDPMSLIKMSTFDNSLEEDWFEYDE